MRRRQTEGDPRRKRRRRRRRRWRGRRRSGTCGTVSATCGPRGERKNRFTYAHSWTDEEASGTTLQSWVRPLHTAHTLTQMYNVYLILSG